MVDDTLACQPPGATSAYAEATIVYDCALVAGSERTGTRVQAGFTGAADGWGVQIVYRDANGALTETASGPTAGAMLTTAVEPGSEAAFQVRILTPGEVPAESAVAVTLSTGIATTANPAPALDGPEASLNATAIPYPPNTLTCPDLASTGIMPGETAETGCAYTVNGPSEGASVTAAFAALPGTGWELEIERTSGGDPLPSPRGETTTWATGEPLARDTAFDLIVRIHAPVEAEPGQAATIAITAADATGPGGPWTVTVSEPPVSAIETEDILTCNGPEEPRPGPGETVDYECTWAAAGGEGGSIAATAGNDASGLVWQVSLTSGIGSAGPGATATLAGVMGNPETGFTASVVIPEDASPGDTSLTTLAATCTNADAPECSGGTATIGTIVGQTADETGAARLDCSTASDSIVSGGSVSVNCDLSTEVEDVTLIGFSGTVPSGWTAAIPNAGDLVFSQSGDAWTLAPATPKPLSSIDPMTFTLTIGAPCTVTAGNHSITVTADIAVDGTSVTVPGLNLGLAATEGNDAPASAALVGTSPLSPGSIGTTGGTGSGTAHISIGQPACLADDASMFVTVSASGNGQHFDGPGAIPLNELSVTSIGFADGSTSADWLDLQAYGGPFNDSVDIATINSAGGGTANLDVGLVIEVPPGTAPGTYSATLTVSITRDDP